MKGLQTKAFFPSWVKYLLKRLTRISTMTSSLDQRQQIKDDELILLKLMTAAWGKCQLCQRMYLYKTCVKKQFVSQQQKNCVLFGGHDVVVET